MRYEAFLCRLGTCSAPLEFLENVQLIFCSILFFYLGLINLSIIVECRRRQTRSKISEFIVYFLTSLHRSQTAFCCEFNNV